MELAHALDLDERGARAANPGAHLVEHVGKVHDLGLARGVVDDGGALGMHRGHHEVLGGTDARELERHGVADDAVGRRGVDVAMCDLEVDAQGLEAEDVQVDLAGADVAAARHGHHGAAEAREQGAEHGRGGAHLGDELVGGLPLVDRGGVDDEGVLVDDVDRSAEALEHLAHHMDVRDVGDVGERGDARGHDGRRHELERGVLGSAHMYLSRDGMATLDLDDVHATSVQMPRPPWGRRYETMGALSDAHHR